MIAFYQRRRGLGAVLEDGFVAYNDDKDQFEKLKEVPLGPPLFPRLPVPRPGPGRPRTSTSRRPTRPCGSRRTGSPTSTSRLTKATPA